MNQQKIDQAKLENDCRVIVEADLGKAPVRSGDWDMFICPFHGDSDPSLGVKEDGYHCFGCEAHGDVIDWVKEFQGVSFKRAIQILGGDLDIDNSIDYARRLKKRLEDDIKEAEQALAQLQDTNVWSRYHSAMSASNRAYWRERGIIDDFIDYWKLGYSENMHRWGSPSITIPVWGHDWDLKGVKHRLLNPSGRGRYRNEMSGVPAHPMVCNPELENGELLIVEGEIKSMVTFQETFGTYQVAGMPSKSPNKLMLECFGEYDPIYICFDPDATNESLEAAKWYSGRGHDVGVIELPDKIDDLFLVGALDMRMLNRLKKNARML